jgi:uncharacterized protein (DUF169 family)
MDFTVQAKQLENLLGLRWPPIALTFRESAPKGISRVEAAAPSGCTYWKLAAEGKVFYTEAADHYGCPIGAYTHGVGLPPAQSTELEGMLETMVGLSYLKPEEIPAIPRRATPFGVAVYAPLADTPLPPDVVLIRGNAKQVMLLSEAINAAAPVAGSQMMGRPTCAVIPQVLSSSHSATSLGCIGNRVYNELGDDELYCAIYGAQIPSVIEKLESIIHVNRQLEEFHHARRNQTIAERTNGGM